jgi:hypothetical protein
MVARQGARSRCDEGQVELKMSNQVRSLGKRCLRGCGEADFYSSFEVVNLVSHCAAVLRAVQALFSKRQAVKETHCLPIGPTEAGA